MLTVKAVTKIHNLGDTTVTALQGIDLHIDEGEMVCIMGRSGAGISTLLRLLGLLDMPTQGTISIDGQNTTELKERQRSQLRLEKIGYVFQDFALLPEMSALENVVMPAYMRSGNKKLYSHKAKEFLELVGLGERMDHYPKQLSGGEQQRVAIARSLINEPKVIFADEPCANLDSKNAEHVMKLLQR